MKRENYNILGKNIWTLGNVYKVPGDNKPCPTAGTSRELRTQNVLKLIELSWSVDRTRAGSILAEGGSCFTLWKRMWTSKRGFWTFGRPAWGVTRPVSSLDYGRMLESKWLGLRGIQRPSVSHPAPPATFFVFRFNVTVQSTDFIGSWHCVVGKSTSSKVKISGFKVRLNYLWGMWL